VITRDRDGDVAVITLDRHERRNALDVEHCLALREAVGEAAASGARALVVTGAGSSFCAGADLTAVYGPQFRDALYSMLAAVASVPVPVIAAVNGPAIGAGTQLAIACDLRVAAPPAVFAVPTARNGLAVDPWTIRRLGLLAGGATARALLIGCETLDAAAACRRGLADRAGDLADALTWAKELAGLAPLTLAYTKRALAVLFEDAGSAGGSGGADGTGSVGAGGADGTDELERAFEAVWASEDLAEGQRARAERRPPRFRGR
jgi:enoyl-CoA hydratase